MTTNDRGKVIVAYTDGTTDNLGLLVGPKGDQGSPGSDGKDGKDGADGQDGKDGRGIESVTTDAAGNLVVKYTDGTSETIKVDSKPASRTGSSTGERCLPTALGLAIPAALAIPLAFLGFANTQFNIPGFEPVRKQIESMARNIPREAQYAAGGLGLLAALGIIGAACVPTGSK